MHIGGAIFVTMAMQHSEHGCVTFLDLDGYFHPECLKGDVARNTQGIIGIYWPSESPSDHLKLYFTNISGYASR